MSERIRIRRVCLCIGPAGVPERVLQTIVRLAGRVGAELEGLLVKDPDLMRLAAFPFAREVSRATGDLRELDTAALDAAFEALAGRLRAEFQRHADQLLAGWRLRVEQSRFVAPVEAVLERGSVAVLEPQGFGAAASRFGPVITLDRAPLRELAEQIASQTGARLITVQTPSVALETARHAGASWLILPWPLEGITLGRLLVESTAAVVLVPAVTAQSRA